MESKSLKLGLSILKVGFALIGVIICLYILGVWDGDAQNVEDIIMPLNIGLDVSYLGLLIGALGMLVFGLIRFFNHIRSNIPMLVGILGFIVLFLVSIFGLSDRTVDYDNWTADPSLLTETTSMLVGGGLISVYVMGAVAVLLIVYVELNKAFK